MAQKVPQLKVKIANLFGLLAKFTPSRDSLGHWDGQYKAKSINDNPTRDELLTMIGEASLEFREVIKEQKEDLKVVSGVMMLSQAIDALIPGHESKELLDRMDILEGRYKQMLAILQRIDSGDIHAERIVTTVHNYLASRKGPTLVNQNEKEDTAVQADCPACRLGGIAPEAIPTGIVHTCGK